MLSLSSLACRSAEAPLGPCRPSVGRFVLGLLACASIGCPGVEPTTDGLGGTGGDVVSTNGGHDNSGGAPPPIGGMSDGGASAGGNGTGGGPDCEADLKTDPDNCGKCGRKCLDDENVKTPRCKDGVCVSFCESGFVNISRPAMGEDDGCESPGRRAFVTEDSIPALEVEGVGSADQHCQTLADGAQLGGAWAAWLSEDEDSTSPAVRFNVQPDAPYYLLDFTQIAESSAVLFGGNGGNLDHPIDLTENMSPASNQFETVWTGTNATGLPTGAHCSLWSASGKDPQGTIGSIAQNTPEWTEGAATASCDGVGRLYCFEQ